MRASAADTVGGHFVMKIIDSGDRKRAGAGGEPSKLMAVRLKMSTGLQSNSDKWMDGHSGARSVPSICYHTVSPAAACPSILLFRSSPLAGLVHQKLQLYVLGIRNRKMLI